MTTTVYEVYQEIIDLNLLEDRREYSEEDLQLNQPQFGPTEINQLYRLIQSNFEPGVESLYRSDWTDEQGQKDAILLAQTITESIHQGYDGWSDQEKATIVLYLHDLGLAMKNSK